MIRVLTELPKGWIVLENAATAPIGYVWINNGKSRFSDDYQHALLKRG